MGLPMIQVFMIAAKQISKPVADAVIRYGKKHPVFRNNILIPIGKGLVRMSARLRMRGLGLGEPTQVATVSEAAALEQASELVQQIVLFTYSVGVFVGYYFYTKMTTPENLKSSEFEVFCQQNEKVITELRMRLEELETALRKAGVKVPVVAQQSAGDKGKSSDSPSTVTKDSAAEKKSQFKRVSSLPIDAASSVVLDGKTYKPT
ncbi:hypothetical protein KIN20_036865 [Parelaphostrongylus tenuis]|uniref:OPA3-like protein n=1 Tax=Parelaphostrongylus tenuis TaxID=148309 RepID=A0AAD5RDZ4_PARTN|nr:hypothetical protein KIN20_036865 [Parelaphostrongylus tenuis]